MDTLFKYADVIKQAEEDIAHIQQKSPTNKTIRATYQMLYDTRMLKYVQKNQFEKIRSTYSRLATFKSLNYLCKKGWLEERVKGVYTTADKTLPVLKAKGFNIDTLPKIISGKGMLNEIQNTEVLIQVMKLKYFKALLYPSFGIEKVWLRPDALLVRLDEENKRYKLTFLEIEAKKPDWERYIDRKREKYMRLAHDREFYTKWLTFAKKLGFPQPGISTIKFSVYFIGNIQRDFGSGFKFLKEVSNE